MTRKDKVKIPKDENDDERSEGLRERLKKEFRINKEMLPVKAALFMYVGGVTAFLPYLTLHMQELGLTMEDIAIIYAFLPIASLLGPTVSGILADKFGRYTGVLSLNIVLTALFHSLLLIVPPNISDTLYFNCDSQNYSLSWRECNEDFVPMNVSYSLTLKKCVYMCDHHPEQFRICFSDITTNTSSCIEEELKNHTIQMNGTLSQIGYNNCSQSLVDVYYEDNVYEGISCPNACPLMCKVKKSVDKGNIESATSLRLTFSLYFILRVIGTMTLSSCFTMLDAVVLAKIRESGGDFGKQRMMTMASQAILPLLAGIFIDYANSEKINVNYAPAFYLGDAMLGSTVVILFFMDLKVAATDENITKNIIKLLSKIEIDIFLLIITFLGMCWGFLETYLFIYLNDLGAPTFLLGLTLTVGCASGLPAMFWSDYIVEKAGRSTIFFLSFIAYFVRFVGYSYIPSPWYCFPFEILEVITYQIMWVAAATYCPILAPAGLLATMTGIAGSAHYSLGRGLGSFLGGYIISEYGLKITFRGFGYAALVGAFLHLLAHKAILQKKIETREKLLKLAEAQGLRIKSDRASLDILAMMQNSSRRNSYVM